MLENSPLIKSLPAKEGDPNSPSIHLHLALTATDLLIINMKYLMAHGATEPGLMYAQGNSLRLESAVLIPELFHWCNPF